MNRRVFPMGVFLAVQCAVVACFAAAYSVLPSQSNFKVQKSLSGQAPYPNVKVERKKPLEVTPLYNDAEVVSDEELAAVLKQILPRFSANQLKPNFVEHALRTWRIDATFQDDAVMSGIEMRDFLIDHGNYLASWGEDAEPLLEDRENGVAIRWGHGAGGSVHHDHYLACLTEAGISLDEKVYTASRRGMTINNVLQEALRDFRLDERETEWSAMAFGLWLPATKTWINGEGRKLSFDLIARRLVRGHKQKGVCGGTHRVYSMMLLIRLDDEFQILSKPIRAQVYGELQKVRDLIIAAQLEDGRWPYNWPDGAEAAESAEEIVEYRHVIATGHHLEWLAIAPEELHPPKEQILKAADWIIKNTTEKTPEEIQKKYTFYSHVGNALSLWRGVRPPDYWRTWRKVHPFVPEKETEASTAEVVKNVDTAHPTPVDAGELTEAKAAKTESAKPTK